jgi:2-polyprenyl-6-hydroxyphenyl methylase / 3-demethylubiquinone-9 3-methyltransferase
MFDERARKVQERVMSASSETSSATVDPAELERFARLADDWWNPHGKFKPLHKIGPARLGFIRDRVSAHFHLLQRSMKPFAGLSMLDVGCGGGLIAEPLARLGATVTGIEPAEANIGAARRHALTAGLAIDYRAVRAEDLVSDGRSFDVVVCLEVVEHVPDPAAFVQVCASLVRPGGLMILSTINRTMKAYVLAIVGAEYILRWLPVGTHQWERFITPGELDGHVRATGLGALSCEGLVYNPLSDRWALGRDTDVNYIGAAAKPA